MFLLSSLTLFCVYIIIVNCQQTCNNSPCTRECANDECRNLNYLCESTKECTINCDAACKGNTKVTSYGITTINCDRQSCTGLKLYCLNGECNIECKGFTNPYGCYDMRIECHPDASCIVNCPHGWECSGVNVYCGSSNVCNVIGAGATWVTIHENYFSSSPTLSTNNPSIIPTISTNNPSFTPTNQPSMTPSGNPTNTTLIPSELPTTNPTSIPSLSPSLVPSKTPTTTPTNIPSLSPSLVPSKAPTITPTIISTNSPIQTTNNPGSISPSLTPLNNLIDLPSTTTVITSSLQPINNITILEPIIFNMNYQILMIASIIVACLIIIILCLILYISRKKSNKTNQDKLTSESHINNNIIHNSTNIVDLKNNDQFTNKTDVLTDDIEGIQHIKSNNSIDIESLFDGRNIITTKGACNEKLINNTPELQSNISSNIDDLYISYNTVTTNKDVINTQGDV